MTNKNISSRPEPLFLEPVGKDYLWGGQRLKTEYGKQLPQTPLAESWECSVHPDGLSTVRGGAYDGQTLQEVLRRHPEYVGTHPAREELLSGDALPILVKFIDARENLSVQVHPDDAYARKYEDGQRGKSEMWYVADAQEGARLVYGFNRELSYEELEESLRAGTVERYLQKVPVRRGDVFFVEAGTVHAIGAGILLVEVQESSNLTYRLYDYNRVDKDGKPRPLHIDKALQVAVRQGSPRPRQPMRVLRYRPGSASELLCRCGYFQVERYLLNTETTRALARVQVRENSFRLFVCLGGCGSICTEGGNIRNFFKGDTFFVPAGTQELKFHGKAQFLTVTC